MSEPILFLANEFGFKRVMREASYEQHRLFHGDTEHGRQSYTHPDEPLGYYHREGPCGAAFAHLGARGEVAVVGLGVGSMAAYAAPAQPWVFYEQDPDIARIAQDPALFTHLSRSAGRVEVKLGDGLAGLAAEPEGRFSLVVLDAFSEGDIPEALLTETAISLYLSRLSSEGALLIHATHPEDAVLATLTARAEALCLARCTRLDLRTEHEERTGDRFLSRYVALARTPQTLAALAACPGWTL